MSGEVPYDWIRAVVVAWPIASDCSFDARPTALAPATSTALAAKLEDWLRPRARGVSLDTLRLACELAWNHEFGPAPSLATYLCGVAAKYLVWEGDGVRLHGVDDTPALARQWRWLSLSLPADLLVAALAAKTGVAPPAEHVRLLSRAADVLLGESRFAATHLHVGAALSFRLVWTTLMRAMADTPLDGLNFDRGGPPPFGSTAAFRTRLLQGGIARTLLASFLWSRTLSMADDFAGFVDDARQRGAFDLGEISRRLHWPAGPERAYQALDGALRSLTTGDQSPSPAVLQRLYRRLIGPPSSRAARRVDDLAAQDPLAEWQQPSSFENRTGADSSETHLATHAIRYMLARPVDHVFATVFWQYERIRNLAFRHLVEEPGTAGLDWFSRHYQRISPMRRGTDGILYQSALQVEGQGISLGALEARTSPPSDWAGVRDEARKVARNALAHPLRPGEATRSEIGLVLHFVKLREGTRDGRNYRNADPRQPAAGSRYGNWFAERLAEANAIIRAMRHNPEILAILRAVDIANLELAVPTWPVLPLMARVREASRDAAARLGRLGLTWRAAPLRVTYHAGEDFGRLAHGLRLIDEPIEFGLVGAGDRIGHAVALGTDVDRWAAGSQWTVQASEDRLDDLLWELDRYRSGDIEGSAGRMSMVEAKAEKLAYDIYRWRVSVTDLLDARRQRHRDATLTALGYPWLGRQVRHRGLRHPQADGLLHRYLTDGDVYDRGQMPVEVRLHDSEREFLGQAQTWLRRRLATLAVTVETNPSSNLLIGDLGDIERHPALMLYPLTHAGGGAPVVSISINTDNPLTFASCLGDEFAHFHHALVRNGVSSVDAMRWLDEVREQGWRSRFTLAASASVEVLHDILDRAEPAHLRRAIPG